MKAQVQTVFIFILALVIIGLLVIFGFQAVSRTIKAADEVATTTLINDIQDDINSLRRLRGSSQEFTYNIPGKFDQVCFVRSCSLSLNDCFIAFSTSPESVKAFQSTRPQINLFLLESNLVVESASLGEVTVDGILMEEICQNTTGRLKIRLTGEGDSTLIKNAR